MVGRHETYWVAGGAAYANSVSSLLKAQELCSRSCAAFCRAEARYRKLSGQVCSWLVSQLIGLRQISRTDRDSNRCQNRLGNRQAPRAPDGQSAVWRGTEFLKHTDHRLNFCASIDSVLICRDCIDSAAVMAHRTECSEVQFHSSANRTTSRPLWSKVAASG